MLAPDLNCPCHNLEQPRGGLALPVHDTLGDSQRSVIADKQHSALGVLAMQAKIGQDTYRLQSKCKEPSQPKFYRILKQVGIANVLDSCCNVKGQSNVTDACFKSCRPVCVKDSTLRLMQRHCLGGLYQKHHPPRRDL